MQKVLHGARLACFLDNRLVGVVTDISVNSATPHKELRSIDIPYVLEHMPTTLSVSFSLNILRLLGDGGTQGNGLSAPVDVFMSQKYFTLVLKEIFTDSTVFKFEYCVTNSENWVFAAKNRAMGTIQCSGIVWSNEYF